MKKNDILFWEDMNKAIDRLGSSGQELITWLLKFAQYDIGHLSTGDFLNLQYEVLVFEYLDNLRSLDTLSNNNTWNISKGMLLNEEYVQSYQTIVKDFIKHILSNEAFDIEIPNMLISLAPLSNSTKWKQFFIFNEMGGAFVYHLARLFEAYADRIRQCPGCNIIFPSDRINQNYCTVKCQSRHYMQKYRDTPPERIGKRGRPPKKDNENQDNDGGAAHGKKTR